MAPLQRFYHTLKNIARPIRVSYPSASLSIRFIHQTSYQLFPRADAQDKDSINTNRTEYTKSGTDDEIAGNQEAAFDPSITSPESEKNKASEGNDVSYIVSVAVDMELKMYD
jgi:hypothetical protein